ncbi:odorant receptor 67c-like [Anthonomus grandis grandis]|uniref:odorant receptor 67c-like n=1 Tax=Anthonomus grandis grandis TaxID=2921223 RepID=UPI002165D22C|nr:odorant receptor 67c-like [Anthonomus grandis grandis]
MAEPLRAILQLNIQIFKYLLLWPNASFGRALNVLLLYGYFALNVFFCTPVVWAVLYQVYVGIEDIDVMLEALIAICDIMGYLIAYGCFLKNKEIIENIIKDINIFLKYCPSRVVKDTDLLCISYTKYMIVYVAIGVAFNLVWPLVSRNSCIAQKDSEFYLMHDPCGMPTHNFYPFDANRPEIFWLVYLIEGVYVCHICFVFSLVTVTIIGLMMHIKAQLKCCGKKFQRINYNGDREGIQKEFVICVNYHQEILEYAKRTFNVFKSVVVGYVLITSFATAVIGYQIVQADNIQDRLRYMMLLLAWMFLFFLICLHAQKLQNQSVSIADSVYNSNWYISLNDVDLKRKIMMVIARAQYPLYFKIEYIGVVSLLRFVAVMKTAYSFFTLLLTATGKK